MKVFYDTKNGKQLAEGCFPFFMEGFKFEKNEKMIALDVVHELAKSAGEEISKCDFDAVRNDEWDDAPSEDGTKADCADVSGVEDHEPCGSEGVAYDEAHKHSQNLYQWLSAEDGFDGPDCQSGEEEADDVAAGISCQDTDSTAEAGEDWYADCSEKDVDQYGQGTEFTAQDADCDEYAEGLKGEWYGGWYGNPGTDGNQYGEDCDIYHAQSFCSCFVLIHRENLLVNRMNVSVYDENRVRIK